MGTGDCQAPLSCLLSGDAEGWLGFSGWKEAGQSREWRPEDAREEPVLMCDHSSRQSELVGNLGC